MTHTEILTIEIHGALLRAVRDLSLQPAARRVDVRNVIRLPLGYQIPITVKTNQGLMRSYSITIRAEE